MSHAFAGVVPRVLVASASVRAPRERPHAALRRRLRGAAPARAFFGKDDAYPATLRPPMPLPEAVAVGLSCAVSGAKTALASPSDAWKPLTGAVAALALALDGAGFVAVSKVLSPGDDAGALARLFSELTIVAADGVCLLLAPLVALAVVQQVLPLLGEKILFDGARAAAAAAAADAAASGAPDAEAPAFQRTRLTRLARLEAMETSDGLGLRGLGVAASRTGTLASLTATATPVGAAATLVPGVGPFLAASRLASSVVVRAELGVARPVLRQEGLRVRAAGQNHVGQPVRALRVRRAVHGGARRATLRAARRRRRAGALREPRCGASWNRTTKR